MIHIFPASQYIQKSVVTHISCFRASHPSYPFSHEVPNVSRSVARTHTSSVEIRQALESVNGVALDG